MSERLFFAIWPDTRARTALARIARDACAGRRARLVPPANLHLTLAFLGSGDADAREQAEHAAASVVAAPFEIRLDALDRRSRSRMLWSTATSPAAALTDLATALREALAGHGFVLEARPFHAHVTLARAFRGHPIEPAHPPVSWSVRAFDLVASETRPEGARYRTVARWKLA